MTDDLSEKRVRKVSKGELEMIIERLTMEAKKSGKSREDIQRRIKSILKKYARTKEDLIKYEKRLRSQIE